ncbi:MAG: hypothetical protein K0R92_827 [Lachnospiraceae bacterium]|jgi:hypothetical protein|nr:hypothetical protein [Lachnospiraceae bacterium]
MTEIIRKDENDKKAAIEAAFLYNILSSRLRQFF